MYPLVKYDSHSSSVSPHLVYTLVRDCPDVIFEYINILDWMKSLYSSTLDVSELNETSDSILIPQPTFYSKKTT